MGTGSWATAASGCNRDNNQSFNAINVIILSTFAEYKRFTFGRNFVLLFIEPFRLGLLWFDNLAASAMKWSQACAFHTRL